MPRLITISIIWTLLFGSPVFAEAWDIKGGAGVIYGSTFRSYEKDGVGFQAYFDLGLTETLSLTASGGFSSHFVGDGQAYSLANAGAGILYNIDVLVIVPFASVRLGWLYQNFETEELVCDFVIVFNHLAATRWVVQQFIHLIHRIIR